MRFLMLLAAVLVAAAPPSPTRAETGEVRLVRQFGLGYLPVHVAVQEKLIEKHLAAAGLKDTKVTLLQATSGAAANDYLLSGSADFAMGGSTVMMTMWDKTKGNANVRAMMALCDSPMYLTTIDPKIRTIADYGDNDRIAVTAIKITQQALTLQMVAARDFGWDNRFKLDPMTVSLSHPDAVAALLSGRHEIKSYMATVPFYFQVAADPRVRTILTSYDVLGGSHSSFAIFNTEGWKTKNPKTYKAVAAGFDDAMELIARDKRAAAAAYLSQESSKLSADEVYGMLLREGDMHFKATPTRTQEVAEFMHRVGTLKNRPPSWRDMFWENVHDRPGS
jgi:NitT/TauT family transport system substrate-binding protein